ncbi:flagellar hook protein FlgE [Roseomonas sp. CCTCC AB2023176]|uniref:flagellar hook protein FlgE n=1 Tax=Roseomonas sp. CCTCC AB2023176 TaxID=3342640 RepID=UPI0035D7AC3E
MSLYTSMTTAISGLTAQSRALGNVADNVANSQTIGFKRTDTNFVQYVTRSTQRLNLPGSVMARPDYQNSVQGTLQQTDNPLAIAIAGQGFFSVAQQRGTQDGLPVFDENPLYTRAGDFRMDRNGYLVNGQGYFLQAWRMDPTGNPDRTQLSPMRVDQTVYNPVATSRIEMSANLPADNTLTPSVAQAQVFDALGRTHTLDLTWTNLGPNRWRLSVSAADDVNAAARGSVEMFFGDAATPPVADGTLGSFANATGSLAGSASVPNTPARITFDADFGQGTQPMTLEIGTFGASDGITQFKGQQISVSGLSQNGVPPGAFSGVALAENGDISINYDNGQIRTVGRVPIASFRDPDRLQRVDGQAFQRTQESGGALIGDPATLGIGKLVTNTLEGSNVDIASEFSKLILAQRAYTANTKIVTATDELLQDTLNMRR